MSEEGSTGGQPLGPRRAMKARLIIWGATCGLFVVFAVIGLVQQIWIAGVIFGIFAAWTAWVALQTSKSGQPHSFMTALLVPRERRQRHRK